MLTICIENVDGLAIVECNGRIVQSEAAFALREAVISQEDSRVILLDLSGVTAIEGGGLGMLEFLQRWAYDHDRRLKLYNPTRCVSERLDLANPIPEFEVISPDEMRALLASTHGH